MRSSKLTAAIAAAALLSTLGACDTATDPDDDAPRGLRISLNGATLVRIDGSRVNGTLHTHVAEYSGQFIIQPVNAGGHAIPAAGAFALETVVADPTVATFVPLEPGAFEGEIVAHREGGTSLTFRVVHASDGSDAYVAPPIALTAAACSPIGGMGSAACIAP